MVRKMKQSKKDKIKIEEDAAIVEVYAEGMRVGINENELSLEFGEIKRRENEQVGIIKTKIKVNPEFLNAIVKTLIGVGEFYNKTYKKEIVDINAIMEK